MISCQKKPKTKPRNVTAAEAQMYKTALNWPAQRGLHVAITILNCRAVLPKDTDQMKYISTCLTLHSIK